MARDICIKGVGGKEYCQASPIRDCGCNRKDFTDPFPDLPAQVTPENFLKDLEQVVATGLRTANPADWQERLRVILVAARLVLIPEVEILKPFVIMTLDVHVPEKPPTGF